MKLKLSPKSRTIAKKIIQTIDEEGKYLATSAYEIEGRKLLDALAYAYILGAEDARKGVSHGESR